MKNNNFEIKDKKIIILLDLTISLVYINSKQKS